MEGKGRLCYSNKIEKLFHENKLNISGVIIVQRVKKLHLSEYYDNLSAYAHMNVHKFDNHDNYNYIVSTKVVTKGSI